MRAFFNEFKKFISRGNVVDMAVGVAVASAFTKIVTAFTNGFITPLLSLLSKDASLSEAKWIIRQAVTHLDEAGEIVVDVPEVAIMWGIFLQAIIDFLLIAFMLFVVMKTFNTLTARAKELNADIREGLTPDKVKAAAEEKAKAEAEAKAAEEAAARAAAEAEAARLAAEKKAELDAYAAQVACTEQTAKLLTEIRDLLKDKQ